VTGVDVYTVLAIYFGVLFLLIFAGLRIAFALGIIAVGSVYVGFGPQLAPALGRVTWDGLTSFVLSAIPLFVLMGSLLFETGRARPVYSGISPLLDRMLPGGLLHSNIVGGAILAACSGSSMACCAMLGSMALPEMERRGYERALATGSVAAAGTLGILIPPSIVFIVYGAMTQQSVGQLFIAGVVPGLLLTAAYMVYIAVRVHLDPALARRPDTRPSWSFALRSLLHIWPILALIVGVLGSIYGGIATPTEAAAVGCALVVVLALLYRTLTWAVLRSSVDAAVRTSSMLLTIFLGAKLMGVYLANAGIPTLLARSVAQMDLSPTVVFLLVVVFYLVLGMAMDSLAAIVMTLPVTFPLVTSLGYDPIWFGVVLTMLAEAGLLSPPVGMNLFVLQGLRPDYRFGTIVRGSVPFFVVVVAMVGLMMAFPDVVTFLPRATMGR
jgi:tripartite ATP-independent transporter DctM subunit